MKIIDSLSRLMGYVATGMVGLMMLLIVADVFMRFSFNQPILGTTEIGEFMMVIVVFMALAWCAVARKHIAADVVMSRLPSRVQLIVDIVTLLFALGTFVIITWQSFLESMDTRAITTVLKVPHFPFHWIMSLGLAVFCLAMVSLVIKNITEARKR